MKMSRIAAGIVMAFGAVMSAQAASTAQIPVVGGLLQPVLGSLSLPMVGGGLPALSLPSSSALPGLGSLPTLGSLPGLGSLPVSGSLPGLSSLPGLGSLPGLPTSAGPLASLLNGSTATGGINQVTQTTTALYPTVYSLAGPLRDTVLSQPMVASIAPTALGFVQNNIGAQAPGLLTNVVTPGFGTLVSPTLEGVIEPAAISFANFVPQTRQVLAITPLLTPAGLPLLVGLVVP